MGGMCYLLDNSTILSIEMQPGIGLEGCFLKSNFCACILKVIFSSILFYYRIQNDGVPVLLPANYDYHCLQLYVLYVDSLENSQGSG